MMSHTLNWTAFTCADPPADFDDLGEYMQEELLLEARYDFYGTSSEYHLHSGAMRDFLHARFLERAAESIAKHRGYPFTNGQWKGAMLIAGHTPTNPTDRYWRFNIRPAPTILAKKWPANPAERAVRR